MPFSPLWFGKSVCLPPPANRIVQTSTDDTNSVFTCGVRGFTPRWCLIRHFNAARAFKDPELYQCVCSIVRQWEPFISPPTGSAVGGWGAEFVDPASHVNSGVSGAVAVPPRRREIKPPHHHHVDSIEYTLHVEDKVDDPTDGATPSPRLDGRLPVSIRRSPGRNSTLGCLANFLARRHRKLNVCKTVFHIRIAEEMRFASEVDNQWTSINY